MGKINAEQVEYIAKLARLAVSPEEVETLSAEMGAIIDFANKLDSLDTSGVEPTTHAIPVYNGFRQDVRQDSYPREEILANAAEKDESAFLVPKVM